MKFLHTHIQPFRLREAMVAASRLPVSWAGVSMLMKNMHQKGLNSIIGLTEQEVDAFLYSEKDRPLSQPWWIQNLLDCWITLYETDEEHAIWMNMLVGCGISKSDQFWPDKSSSDWLIRYVGPRGEGPTLTQTPDGKWHRV